MTLASFIQPRAVVCVSYAHTAVLSHRSVCITHDEKRFATPKDRIRREVVLLFIYSLYIFTLLNMRVIILVNILYCRFIYYKARSSSIVFTIDLLGIPDLSDNV